MSGVIRYLQFLFCKPSIHLCSVYSTFYNITAQSLFAWMCLHTMFGQSSIPDLEVITGEGRVIQSDFLVQDSCLGMGYSQDNTFACLIVIPVRQFVTQT